ncbi:hypothetical protein [Streptomyces spinoverrucosus]|uniref:hypothetical protein n=1 Tax=Streptomyces spinoverrucosus TaxID=284043 RepID=UPI001E63B019|nr:hypothetical protein [Streptomyces spinoverrucosus]
MIRRMFRRCGDAPGALTPEDQAVVDAFRALLAACNNPQPWTPGCNQDVAVRVGPFLERAQPRPGDDHGPDLIAVTLVHPGAHHRCWHRRCRRSAAGAAPSVVERAHSRAAGSCGHDRGVRCEACHIQRITLENQKLREELEAGTGGARLTPIPSSRDSC